jgi:hypothetical protein
MPCTQDTATGAIAVSAAYWNKGHVVPLLLSSAAVTYLPVIHAKRSRPTKRASPTPSFDTVLVRPAARCSVGANGMGHP